MTETPPAGSSGLPDSSHAWDTPTISAPVTIAADRTGTVTVTNRVKRVYGNFSVTKVVPAGSVVDDAMTFRGDWSCTLGSERTAGTWGPIAPGATWTSATDARIPLGATCTVTERRAAEPVGDGSQVWDGDPLISGAVVARISAPEVITVTNRTRPVAGSLTWSKTDEKATLLAGSEWTLQGPGPAGAAVPIADCTADGCGGPDTDPDVGEFHLIGLAWGEYTLTETRAPAGFYPLRDPIRFIVGAPATETVRLDWDLGAIVNTRRVGPTLPLTGGIGRDAFLMVGSSVAILGLGGLALAQLRTRRRTA